MAVHATHARACLFDAMVHRQPAVFAATALHIDTLCARVRDAAIAHHRRCVVPAAQRSILARCAPRTGTILRRVLSRVGHDEPELSVFVASAVTGFLLHPDSLSALSALNDAIGRFRHTKIVAAAAQLLASAQLVHEASADAHASITRTHVERMQRQPLCRFAIRYTQLKARFPAIADLPFSVLALNGSELMLQLLRYGAIDHPERFAWTIPFSLAFSPLANALIRMVGRVPTQSSVQDRDGAHLASSLASLDLTATHRAAFRKNAGEFLLIGDALAHDVLPALAAIGTTGVRTLRGQSPCTAVLRAVGHFLCSGLRCIATALLRLAAPRERVENLRNMRLAAAAILTVRRGEIRRAYKFFAISYWLDLLQIAALETTRAVAVGAPFAVGQVALQYFQSLGFSAGLSVVDYPTQNYLPMQWRVPVALASRAAFFIWMGCLTMP